VRLLCPLATDSTANPCHEGDRGEPQPTPSRGGCPRAGHDYAHPMPWGRSKGRTPRRGWAATTLIIAVFGVAGFVQWTWTVVADGGWWNIPFGLTATALTYWVGMAAWRCTWAPSDLTTDGPHTGHTARPRQVTRDS
jgi:hypothetical protein